MKKGEGTLDSIESYSKVAQFLSSKARRSERTKITYGISLQHFETFLSSRKYNVESILVTLEKGRENVYSILDDFIGYLESRKEKLSSASIILYVAGVRSYLEYHEIDISSNKFKKKVTLPRQHKSIKEAIDAEDIRTILQSCDNERLRVFILVLSSSGLRSREALTLTNGDIDFNSNPSKLHISGKNSKTGRSHDSYISDEASTHLKKYIDSKYKNKDEYDPDHLIFTYEPRYEIGIHHIYGTLNDRLTKVLEKVDMKRMHDGLNRKTISFHSLRSFVKSVVANQTNSDFSEWVLNHEGSTYYQTKESERRELYLKCEPYLTFLSYETTISVGSDYLSKLAERDKELADLRQNLQGIAESVRKLENNAIAGDGWFQDSVVGKIENILKKRDSKIKKTD